MAGSSKVVRLADARNALAGRAPPDADAPASPLRASSDGQPEAESALISQFGGYVERILVRILGAHPDFDDLVQDVFVRALERLDDRDPSRPFKGWLGQIAVNVAREAIRRRKRRRWLLFLSPEEVPELEVPSASPEARAALRAFYEVLDQLDTDDRIAFTLRVVEGMPLAEIADACGVSLATIKRRIARAERTFTERSRAHEALADWSEEET